MGKLHYVKTKREETPNWRGGDPIDPNKPKEVVVVYFEDEYGRIHAWSPLKNEPNQIAEHILQILRSMILAEERNFPNLKNPEPRSDIAELRRLAKKIVEFC